MIADTRTVSLQEDNSGRFGEGLEANVEKGGALGRDPPPL